MATVKALYNYSYDYEGSKITFQIGEEFQLLSKANTDWWHVRRWTDGIARDIYVPAVYVKEDIKKEVEVNPTYENVAELMKKRKAKERASKNDEIVNGMDAKDNTPPPAVGPKPPKDAGQDMTTPTHRVQSPKPSPKHKPKVRSPSGRKSQDAGESGEGGEGRLNGVPKPSPEIEYAEPSLPILRKGNKESSPVPVPVPVLPPTTTGVPVLKGIREGWKQGYALPVVLSKPRSRSEAPPPPTSPTSASPAPPTGPAPNHPTVATFGGTGGLQRTGKVPPPVLPKVKASQRPKSMIVTSTSPEPHYETPDEARKMFLNPVPCKSVKPPRAPSTKRSDSEEAKVPERARPQSGNLGLRKTPSPKQVGVNAPVKPPTFHNGGSLPRNSSPLPPLLPEGWTEHMTGDGHTYYHNTLTGQSSWTRPQAVSEEVASPASVKSPTNPLEKVAPRGWTKEINLFTQTPIYTNCRNGERWALAKDSSGTFYYYNMANSSLTVGELPAIDDLPTPTSTTPGRSTTEPSNIYDRLNPISAGSEPSAPRQRLASEPVLDGIPPITSPKKASLPMLTAVDVFTSSLANVLTQKKHGYLQRKRLYDVQGKRVKGGWQKMYVVLQDHQLFFYTDHKAVKEAPGATPQCVFSLLQSTVSPYTKDKKRTIFQVSSSLGEQFLLQAETSPLMNDWYSTIQTTIDQANTDYRLHPEKYKGMEDVGDQPSKNGTGGKSSSWKHARKASATQEIAYDDDEDLDDPEISAADKSVRIRSRLKKLMARRPQLEALKKSGIIEDPVFGCELSHLCEREKSNVPRFLVKFMEHIEKKGLDTVGLYRLSGNAASVQKLRFVVEADYTLIDLDDEEWADINIITGCLKLYLRELPEPVVPFKSFQGFIDAARSGTPQQRLAAIAARVKELPTPNYFTLKAIITHLRKVVEFGHINKMQSQNVAIVFGPTLMRAETDLMQMATLMPIQNGIVELMVTEFKSIFRK